MAYDPDLAARIRAALGGATSKEVKMFGGLSFMVDQRLTVSASGHGGLLVRCDPTQVDELLDRPGAAVAEMRGQPMKKGWLHIDGDSLDDESLLFWVDIAVAYNRSLGRG